MHIKTIHFIRNQNNPLYLQLYQKIEQDITAGFLHKGDRLPSVRQLAKALDISRTTIEAAYGRLCMNGYVVAAAKKGFFVAIDSQDAKKRKDLLSNHIEKKYNHIKYDFSSDSIDPLCFDEKLWKRYIKESLDDKQKIYSYGDIQGELELRIALQKYAYTMRGVLCKVEQIIIGSSFQSLLYQLCGLMKKPQIIAMEDSGFGKAEQVFEDYGFTVIKIPTQEADISLEALQQHPITALYLNSAAIGKSKKSIPATTRNALLSWARKRHILIIEDDHNGELRYVSKQTSAMQGMDPYQQVIYIGSFSKLLLPSLRIGYMVLNPELQRKYENRKHNYSPTSSKIEQMALAHYISDGHLERQIRRSKRRYEYKSRIFLAACKEIFPEWDIYLEETALRIRLHAPAPYPVNAFLRNALKEHIRVQKNSNDDLLLSFTSIQIEDLNKVFLILRRLWEELK